jgi:hypothetical protein
MKMTINFLKDPRAGLKQIRYIEHFLWIRKNTGVWNFVDRFDILLTYLPIFPPMKGEVLKKISYRQNATILNDALPHYYIKKIKEANTEPTEMSLEDLFQFALNIEQLLLILERMLRAILGIARSRKQKPQFLGSRGVKIKIIRRVE